MNKTLITLSSLLALGLLIFSGCNDKTGKSKVREAATAEDIKASSEKPIAYVRLDSLYSQYAYYKEITEELAKLAETNRQQLVSKANLFSKSLEEFERKNKMNAFLTAESQQTEERKLMIQRQQGQQLESKLTQEFIVRQQEANDKLNETVKKHVAKFNNGRYRFILTDMGAQSMLFADSTLDITNEVVKYLNAHYRKGEVDK